MKTNHLIIAGLVLAVGSATILQGKIFSNGKISAINSKTITPNSEADLSTISKFYPATKKASIPNKIVKNSKTKNTSKPKSEQPRCVFKTAFEGEGLDQGFYYKIPGKIVASIDHGLEWLVDAQLNDGGWGAGSHQRQDVLDPHRVQSDPATTAMAAMALQRSGTNLYEGSYSKNLRKALEFLLEAVEDSEDDALNITTLTHTQPQTKLGKNIDVVLTSQFLSNVIHDINDDPQLRRRIKKSIQKCVNKIENGQSANGSQQGSGWAGVLQSSFATSALETAQIAGVEVTEDALEKSRDFQKNNINPETNSVATESAAGIVLYSVSGSTRASAKETAEAKDIIKKAKQQGLIDDDEVNVSNLKKAGVPASKAMKYNTAYQVNKSAKRLAQDDNVMTGFGNNGGEEFLSYLQTGEGMIMSKDDDWKSWYDKVSGRLLNIQNNNGSWNGHHCITSPVFCTATCLLILTVNNDIDKLTMNQKNQ